ncbi:MAG: PQQ-dependent sugar dehydrogenase, partial [Dehalococcoidia bacterium]|nr:PQQ-dependent sugar dehydrogenase [Dehalococcoidia bacterium]
RVNEDGNEEGLLGLAFDPDYKYNGYFYVYYSAASPRRSVLSRFSVSPNDPKAADPNSETVIMQVTQPFSNHNGGQIAFGPDDYLYVGLGDGGSRGDPQRNGQNTGTLLGSILRIDVKDVPDSEGYRIPSDNPLVGVSGARDEILAYGLRNPWRFSFDERTGVLW